MHRIAVAAAFAFGLSGCSLLAVQPSRLPFNDPTVPEPCTASVAPAVLDTVAAAAAAGASWYQMLEATYVCDGSPSCRDAPTRRSLAFLGGAVALAGSAIYGYVATHRCRRNTVLSARCRTGDLYECRILTPGWQPAPGRPDAWPAQVQPGQ